MMLNITTLVVASLLLALPLYQASGEEWVAVKTWNGSADMTTEKFEAKASWRIEYDITKQYESDILGLTIIVYDNNGYMVENFNDLIGIGQTYIHESGIFYLAIRSIGVNWKVSVQVPSNNAQTVSIGEKIALSNLQMVDQLGSRINDVSVGQQVVLQSSVKNNVAADQKFAYIMHIKDSDGITIMIAWINGEIPSSKTFDIGLSWIPDVKGKYDVSVFVWQSVANPLPLSSKTLSTTISVT